MMRGRERAAGARVAFRATLAIGFVGALAGCGAAAVEDGAVEVGRPVPEYSAQSLSGGPASLKELRGKVVLLNVWATWCLPCRTEMPELEAIHRASASQGLAVVGVSVDGSVDAKGVQEFAADHGVTYPLWLDADDRVTGVFYAVGVPATYLIGRDGTLRWKRLGPLRRADVDFNAVLVKALAE